jgi:UDP-galactopyranose mutase
VVNYPSEHAYTRATEFKYLTGQQHPKTTLVYEHPTATGDPHYPIPRAENAERYKRYKRLAEAAAGVHFVGRLASYRYYNMDQVIAQALVAAKRILQPEEASGAQQRGHFHGRAGDRGSRAVARERRRRHRGGV